MKIDKKEFYVFKTLLRKQIEMYSDLLYKRDCFNDFACRGDKRVNVKSNKEFLTKMLYDLLHRSEKEGEYK